MTEVAAEEPPKKGGKMGLILLIAAVLLGGGGGFGAGIMGLVPLPLGDKPDEENHTIDPHPKPLPVVTTTYYHLPELTIPLGSHAASQYLRAKIFLEIDAGTDELLRKIEPRIMDTLNIFLRSVDERDVATIIAMEQLRAEMLRRVRLVAGSDAVHAVLIGEFLLR